MIQQRSQAFREQALRKVLERGTRPIQAVASDLGVKIGTLKGWMKEARRQGREGSVGSDAVPCDTPARTSAHALSQIPEPNRVQLHLDRKDTGWQTPGRPSHSSTANRTHVLCIAPHGIRFLSPDTKSLWRHPAPT